ncbi:DUF349 domain-containing protein [Elizabethkingia sp. JS20170427COW]|uniref:DUF349 domain-containing protein n=1 Tax=Elizabethkingia sp. JS20170427COW TaxID=2583851 RepID=UPI0011109F00|nr:DUF349 domain-containing protein [Elizabethkingia sp. JS20170427COW]QCX53693.1 DUF349 domain-containing protein [Elizabethkingia sp. JS20170427COW]
MADINNHNTEDYKVEGSNFSAQEENDIQNTIEEHLENDASETLDFSQWTLEKIAQEAEKIVNLEDAYHHHKKFYALRDAFTSTLEEETKDKKAHFIEQGGDELHFDYQPLVKSRFNALVSIFKEKLDQHHKEQEEIYTQNLEKRRAIIERLKNLYSDTQPGINYFKEIRSIKNDWQNAGHVSKSVFHTLYNDYYHHLNLFYQMLNLNKEYLEQEHEHNLEKRRQIIEHTRELLKEPLIQKALNDLQFLHKLWKEEAEPVAEEFQESTWEEFKKLSNQVIERKNELIAQISKEQESNLLRKNAIIEAIDKLAYPSNKVNHSYWQSAIQKVEKLREEFIALGKVPKKESAKNWQVFKETLRGFNLQKNNFYKEVKKLQHENLIKKRELIQIAKENQNSEDWEVAVPLFKELQKQWKNTGHITKSKTEKVWEEFQQACNAFFDNFRNKTGNGSGGDDWKENYRQKKQLLDRLKNLSEEEASLEVINEIKNQWNAIGKVPKEKLSINSEFNKTLKTKMKVNNLKMYNLSDENLSDSQLTEKARKYKNQISDLQNEISNLENNLSFFSNPTRENPLLAASFQNLDKKKEELEALKQALHQIIEDYDSSSEH